MKDKILLLVVFIGVVATLIIKALELLNVGYDIDKILACVWAMVALHYCLKANKKSVED